MSEVTCHTFLTHKLITQCHNFQQFKSMKCMYYSLSLLRGTTQLDLCLQYRLSYDVISSLTVASIAYPVAWALALDWKHDDPHWSALVNTSHFWFSPFKMNSE